MHLVHVTQEAVQQFGGIGAVLRGLITSASYRGVVERTILLGPAVEGGKSFGDLLGQGGRVDYAPREGVEGPDSLRFLRDIENRYGVGLLYGSRSLEHPSTKEKFPVEAVLVQATNAPAERFDRFKYRLWQRFGLTSDRYEANGEYELFLRLAEPGYEAVRGLLGGGAPVVLIAHEFMGLFTAFKVILEREPGWRTVFHAHEVATARSITESSPGHDTMFYRALRAGLAAGHTAEEVFGPQDHLFKHALVRRAHHCDRIFAVGDSVVDELRFLAREFHRRPIDRVYNGIPCAPVTWTEKARSRDKLRQFCRRLLGSAPDFILSHVARPVISKGFWRDFQVLLYLDRRLERDGRQAVFFVVASHNGEKRSEEQVREMEIRYGWPSHHRADGKDLKGAEIQVNGLVESFNLVARNIRAVLVNQFGWSRTHCGSCAPEDMEFADLRRGADAELGLSIYEPFGIAQLEPLTFGAISVISSVCGCRGFLECVGAVDSDQVLCGDYVRVPEIDRGLDGCLRIGRYARDQIEVAEARRIARELDLRLTTNPASLERRAEQGYALANRMSWDVVAREQFLPALLRIPT
jgi:hypothetical protein